MVAKSVKCRVEDIEYLGVNGC